MPKALKSCPKSNKSPNLVTMNVLNVCPSIKWSNLAAAITLWYRLCLPSCSRGFKSQAHIYTFFNLYYWNCNEKRTKEHKRGRDWSIFKVVKFWMNNFGQKTKTIWIKKIILRRRRRRVKYFQFLGLIDRLRRDFLFFVFVFVCCQFSFDL